MSPEAHPPTTPGVSESNPGTSRIAKLTAELAARDTFLAVAAHELRNPITPLLGQVELLLSGVRTGKYSPEQVERRLERVQLSIRRYWQRASVLLDVSRISSGQFRPELEPVDLAALLRGVAVEYQEAARIAGASIRVKVAETLPGTWDRLALEQIVDNLVSNALKYGGGTSVEISGEVCDEIVRLSVRDHGSGIAAEDRERIFGRFERAIGRGERRGGYGIGLWLVCQLAKAMDGDIVVEDAPGGGALFTVTLPEHVKGARC